MIPPVSIANVADPESIADDDYEDIADPENMVVSDDVEDDNAPIVNAKEGYLHDWNLSSQVWEEEKGDIDGAFNDNIEMGYIKHPGFMTDKIQLPSNLFVRPAYRRLMNKLCQQVRASDVLITGTPGIGQYSYVICTYVSLCIVMDSHTCFFVVTGKSACLLYALLFLLHRAKTERFSIVAEIFGCAAVVFPNGGKPSSDPTSIRQALPQPKTWYLFDAKPEINITSPTRLCSGFVLFASSPSPSADLWVLKGATATRHVMSLWNLAELCACRQSCVTG